jgi:hypothetical protein
MVFIEVSVVFGILSILLIFEKTSIVKRYFLFFLFEFFLFSCVPPEVIEVKPEVSLKILRIQSDSLSKMYFVLGKSSCDNLYIPDSAYKIYCGELNNNSIMFDWVNYRNQNFSYSIHPIGIIEVIGPYCQKTAYDLKSKDSFKNDRILWTGKDTNNGRLVLYEAEMQKEYPFYKLKTLDSSVFDLKNFCTEEEVQEHIQDMNQFINKYVTVEITPNPFVDAFSMEIKCEVAYFWAEGDSEKKLTIKDSKGNVLVNQIAELDTPYEFRLENVPKGEILFYSITWSNYVVQGKVMKAR